PGLLHAIHQAEKELPYVREMVTAQFTSKFVRSGPIDKLPDSLQRLVAIPAKNDVNEGILGSMRLAARFHPSISTSNFSVHEQIQHNNTDNFIWKVMTRPEDHTYVMRRVREDDTSGKNRKFNVEVAE
ncbi:hypothetical protein K438DRAFT_1442334, partial [Mycena galopus ATCC 62051]